MLHEHEEMAIIVGVLNGPPEIRREHSPKGRLAALFPEPFDVAHGPWRLTLHNDGEAVFFAQPVGDSAYLPIVALGVAVVFAPI